MFWQQKMTPSTADPAQQRIMMMMPLMFGVMFLAAPSGLVLYWFVGNLFADWPAVLHELVDRASGRGDGQAASGATHQERRVGPHRGSGEQELESASHGP
jgi:hypothetical protein